MIASIQFCPKALLKVPITYITIPILDKRLVPKRGRRVQHKLWGRGKRGKRKNGPSKKCKAKPVFVNVQWPVLNPYLVFSELVRAGAFALLAADGWDWRNFWQTAAASEDWMEAHPVLNEPASAQAHAVGATWHGDGAGQTLQEYIGFILEQYCSSRQIRVDKVPLRRSF